MRCPFKVLKMGRNLFNRRADRTELLDGPQRRRLRRDPRERDVGRRRRRLRLDQRQPEPPRKPARDSFYPIRVLVGNHRSVHHSNTSRVQKHLVWSGATLPITCLRAVLGLACVPAVRVQILVPSEEPSPLRT